MKTPRAKSEAKIQQECVIWYTNNYCLKHHDPREIIFHVANENQHRLFKLGLLPGVSDLILTFRGQVYFVEVKTETGTQRPAQIEFQERIEALGFKYFIVRSESDFKEIILHLSNDVNKNPRNKRP